jgi:hypothetical protein
MLARTQLDTDDVLVHSAAQILPIQVPTFGGSARVPFQTVQILGHKCLAFP